MDTSWPICTVPGCRHKRSHRDGNAMFEAIREHDDWTDPVTGMAVCSCHPVIPPGGPRSRFGCDVALFDAGVVTR